MHIHLREREAKHEAVGEGGSKKETGMIENGRKRAIDMKVKVSEESQTY